MSNGTLPISMRDIRLSFTNNWGLNGCASLISSRNFPGRLLTWFWKKEPDIDGGDRSPEFHRRQGRLHFRKGHSEGSGAFHDAFKKYCEGGWIAASVDAEAGGQGLPESLGVATSEMFVSACCGLTTYPGLTRGCANLIESFGTPDRRHSIWKKCIAGSGPARCALRVPGGQRSGGYQEYGKKRSGIII